MTVPKVVEPVPGKAMVIVFYRLDMVAERCNPVYIEDGWGITGGDISRAHESAVAIAQRYGHRYYQLFQGPHPRLITSCLSLIHEVL